MAMAEPSDREMPPLEQTAGDVPGDVLLDVPMVKQVSVWDCGIASALMVIRHYGSADKTLDELKAVGKGLGMTESTWTIELCQLLKEHHIDSHYCTITLGVDPALLKQQYYQDRFDEDAVRVQNLFEKSDSLGLRVAKSDAPIGDLLEHLRRRAGPVITLVDSSCVWCRLCRRGVAPPPLRQVEPGTDSVQNPYYVGHYVVLVGYCQTDGSEEVCYLDPSPNVEEHVCCAPVERFEHSRHVFGTDVDTIFIDGVGPGHSNRPAS